MIKLSTLALPILTLLSVDKRNSFSKLLFDKIQINQRSDSYLKTTTATTIENMESFDYIIVGAGSAGSVLANRLSEDSDKSILVLEAGGSENFLTDIPIAYQLMQKTNLDWNYQTDSQKYSCFGLQNQSSFWPRGKVLGGTSVLNVMLYTRGNQNDFDRWPDNWKWQDVYPYFLKSERNHDTDIVANGFHSTSGLLDVRRAPYVTPLAHAFVDSAPQFGYPKLSDLNGPSQAGFAIPQTTNRRGARCSTAKAFLKPAMKYRRNLRVLTHAFVTQVSSLFKLSINIISE